MPGPDRFAGPRRGVWWDGSAGTSDPPPDPSPWGPPTSEGALRDGAAPTDDDGGRIPAPHGSPRPDPGWPPPGRSSSPGTMASPPPSRWRRRRVLGGLAIAALSAVGVAALLAATIVGTRTPDGPTAVVDRVVRTAPPPDGPPPDRDTSLRYPYSEDPVEGEPTGAAGSDPADYCPTPAAVAMATGRLDADGPVERINPYRNEINSVPLRGGACRYGDGITTVARIVDPDRDRIDRLSATAGRVEVSLLDVPVASDHPISLRMRVSRGGDASDDWVGLIFEEVDGLFLVFTDGADADPLDQMRVMVEEHARWAAVAGDAPSDPDPDGSTDEPVVDLGVAGEWTRFCPSHDEIVLATRSSPVRVLPRPVPQSRDEYNGVTLAMNGCAYGDATRVTVLNGAERHQVADRLRTSTGPLAVSEAGLGTPSILLTKVSEADAPEFLMVLFDAAGEHYAVTQTDGNRAGLDAVVGLVREHVR